LQIIGNIFPYQKFYLLEIYPPRPDLLPTSWKNLNSKIEILPKNCNVADIGNIFPQMEKSTFWKLTDQTYYLLSEKSQFKNRNFTKKL